MVFLAVGSWGDKNAPLQEMERNLFKGLIPIFLAYMYQSNFIHYSVA